MLTAHSSVVHMKMHPASCRTTDQVRDVLAFVRRWECAVFQWEPPKGGDNMERTWGGCRGVHKPGLKASLCSD